MKSNYYKRNFKGIKFILSTYYQKLRFILPRLNANAPRVTDVWLTVVAL